MVEFNANDIYVVHPDFRLRNDRKFVIAAEFRQKGVGAVIRLAPISGLIVSLFDGARTCAEVADICTAFFANGTMDVDDNARTLVKKILSEYTVARGKAGAVNPLLVRMECLPTEEQARIRRWQPTDFIVKPSSCRLKDLQYPA